MSASSPKENSSSLLGATPSSSVSRTQRCGVCEGCLAKACGSCVYCKDNPQFGGPGVKKQSCVARRCVRVLEGKLQREAMASRAKKGCGVCDECRDADCGACLVCMDKRFFQGQFLPDALCSKKKCSNAKPMEPSLLSPKSVSSLAATEKKPRHHSDGGASISLNGSSRKTPVSDSLSTHLSRYKQYSGGEFKRRKLDGSTSGDLHAVPSSSTPMRPTASSTIHSGSNVSPVFAHQSQPQSMDAVSLMERAFSSVMQQPSGDCNGKMPQSSSSVPVTTSPLRHPSTLTQPRHHEHFLVSSGSGCSPPAGTTAPVYRNLPIATPLLENAHAMWNPQNSKVLYPTCIEPFSPSIDAHTGGDGFIVTLDGDQLKQHLAGNISTASGAWSSASPGDAEDIELQQKLIEFYQRDKQQQQQSHQQYVTGIGGVLNQGAFVSAHTLAAQSKHVTSLPPSIVAEPIAPMGQSEVVLQQL